MIPEGAQLKLRVQLGMKPSYYKWQAVVCNDGTVAHGLYFWSDNFDTWRGTNQSDPDKFAKDSLAPIPEVAPYDRAAAEAVAREEDRIKLGDDYDRIQKLREETRIKNQAHDNSLHHH